MDAVALINQEPFSPTPFFALKKTKKTTFSLSESVISEAEIDDDDAVETEMQTLKKMLIFYWEFRREKRASNWREKIVDLQLLQTQKFQRYSDQNMFAVAPAAFDNNLTAKTLQLLPKMNDTLDRIDQQRNFSSRLDNLKKKD